MSSSSTPVTTLPFVSRPVKDVLKKAESPGTKKVTESHVNFFRSFLKDIRGYTTIESDKWFEMEEPTLVQLLQEFFSGIKNRVDGTNLQPSYLWNIFSSIRRRLKQEDRVISHQSVDKVVAVIKAVCKELKGLGEGNQPNATDELINEEVMSLFDQRCAGSHNPRALQNAVAIYLMFMGIRGYTELYNVCLR